MLFSSEPNFSESNSHSKLPLVATSSPFASLGLSPALLRALADEGYATPTPIQNAAIPHVLERRDVLACAQTGTGKTAAFVLPLLQHLEPASPQTGVRALVLTPTRELAAQIGERITAYARFLRVRHTVIYGGVGQGAQQRELGKKPSVVVATPGRLLDLMQQGFVKLGSVEFLVLDEADTMLDMGFIHDVRRIIATIPAKRQTLLFSATMPPAIDTLARQFLTNPARVAVAKVASAAETVAQSVYFVGKTEKRALLEHILQDASLDRVLVFTRTKHGANRVAEQLTRAGVGAAAIHGNKSQRARETALEHFKRGTTRVLVATDIAARGIDVHSVSHVVNFELPNVPETYVHRIGRTGRAGAAGKAVSFCDREERAYLTDIERLIRQRIPVVDNNPALAQRQNPTAAQHSATQYARNAADAPVSRQNTATPAAQKHTTARHTTTERTTTRQSGTHNRHAAEATLPKQNPERAFARRQNTPESTLPRHSSERAFTRGQNTAGTTLPRQSAETPMVRPQKAATPGSPAADGGGARFSRKRRPHAAQRPNAAGPRGYSS